MSKLYDEWIDPELSFERHRQSDDLNFFSDYAQEISTIIAHLHRVPADLKVLDFGMGWGKWALMAKGFGCDVFGVELSVERIRYASSSAIACIPWEEIPSHSFDFINTEQVFEHLPNPLDTLIYLKRSLKGNGLLKISVPTANNIATRLEYMDWSAPKGTKYSLNPVAPLEHINYFRRRSLIKMAEIAGMCEVRIPIRTQYKHTTNWCGVTNTLKKIAKPVYRNILKRENYCLFAAK